MSEFTKDFIQRQREIFERSKFVNPIARETWCDLAIYSGCSFKHYPAALDEIERLRSRLEAAEAELERLRKALQEIHQ